MNKHNNNFICPNCKSTKIKFRSKITNVNKIGAYSVVDEEIQCGDCFIDIPKHLGEREFNKSFDEAKDEWIKIFKPEHVKNAPFCSKCNLYYWEIEKKLDIKNMNDGNIFYQNYTIEDKIGKLICKLCNPEAFQK